MTFPQTFSCFLLLAACFGCLASEMTGTQGPTVLSEDAPNVVIIFGDDMAPTHLGTYGGKYLTPSLDQLAKEGIRFDEAFCVASMCTPSRFSLLTGKYPGRNRSAEFLADNPLDEAYSMAWNTPMTDEEVSMGEIFTELGYQTGLVGKWHLSIHEELEIPPLDPKADVSDPLVQRILRERHDIRAEHVRKVSGFQFVQSMMWNNVDVAGTPIEGLRDHNFEWFVNGALEFLDRVEKDRPFLLYFASTAVHGPSHTQYFHANPHLSPQGHVEMPRDYYPPRSQIKRECYEHEGKLTDIQAGMLCLDYQVAAIRKKLKERGLEENTLIIYLADHGIEPGKSTSYLRGTRIPFIATWLDRKSPFSVSQSIVQIPDILPTLYDLATDGAKMPYGDIDGVSFASILRGEEDKGRDYAYFEGGYTRSIYKDGLHYIRWSYPQEILEKIRSGELKEAPDHLGGTHNQHPSITIEMIPNYWDPDQLYDVREDPWELNNVYGQADYTEEGVELKDTLRGVLATFNHPYDMERVDFRETDQELFNKLKQPRLERGTDWIYWYRPGMFPYGPGAE